MHALLSFRELQSPESSPPIICCCPLLRPARSIDVRGSESTGACSTRRLRRESHHPSPSAA
eukprot:6770484-Prymnesium_polylepis.1